MKYNNNKTYCSIALIFLLCTSLFIPTAEVQASNTWDYKVGNYSEVENDTFDDMIWDDEHKRFQLHGKTLYEDFTMYDKLGDVGSQGWSLSGLYGDNNTASIRKTGSKHELYLNRPNHYVTNLGAKRNFSPTRSGEVEFIFTPLSGASRVALNHSPAIQLEGGHESTQFMFRFQPNSNGGNEIRFGTNRGGAVRREKNDR